MARKTTFEETVSFETTGVDDGGDEKHPQVFLESAELNQTPDPGSSTTLELTLGGDESTDAWVTATIDGDEVMDFDWLEVSGSETDTASTVIDVPYADEFEVRVVGGPIV